MERAKSSHAAYGFRLPFAALRWHQSSRSGCSFEEEDSSSVRETRNHRRRLAYVSTYGRNSVSRTGRAPVDDPRLLASLESQCDQQVFAGRIQDQAERSGEIGGGYFAAAVNARQDLRTGCTQIAARFGNCQFVSH